MDPGEHPPDVARTVMIVRQPADQLVAMSTLSFRGAAVGAALHAIDGVMSNPAGLAAPVPGPALHTPVHARAHR